MTWRVGRCLLQDRLNALDMTQVELAEHLGMKKQQINKYVTNETRMSILTAKNVSSILNCSIDDLYEWIEVGDETSR